MRIKDFLTGVTDRPFKYQGAMSTPGLTCLDHSRIARTWLKAFQQTNISRLRGIAFQPSRHYADVTIITYTYPRSESDFIQIEFAILHTWKTLGRLKTVIVSNRIFPMLDSFSRQWCNDIEIQIQPKLKVGDTTQLTLDCLQNLHSRFSTPHCMTIQDDGFPINTNLEDFLGRYDFWGAPAIRARYRPIERIIEARKMFWLNGGFSLRTKKICQLAANAYRRWKVAHPNVYVPPQEDLFFTRIARSDNEYARKIALPTLDEARHFSAQDICGLTDIRARKFASFGFHSPPTAIQLIPEFRSMGYSIPPME